MHPAARGEEQYCVAQMLYQEMLANMQRSKFRLIPPGETASSRRLTDAILSNGKHILKMHPAAKR